MVTLLIMMIEIIQKIRHDVEEQQFQILLVLSLGLCELWC